MVTPTGPRPYGSEQPPLEGLPLRRRLPLEVQKPPVESATPLKLPVETAFFDTPVRQPSAKPQAGTRKFESYFWLRRSDQLLVGTLAAIVLVLLVVHWARLSGWGMRPVEIERLPRQTYAYRIDVNTAPWVELALLEGIGEVLAKRIVDDREQNGPFETVDDLDRVRGIGPKTLERIRPEVMVGTPGQVQ